MNFSENTMNVLKNFAFISQSITFEAGKQIRSIDEKKTVFAIAQIEDEIPSEAHIYELPRLLAALAMFEQPDIEFKTDHFLIKGGKAKIKYAFAQKTMVPALPSKSITIKEDVTFALSWSDLENAVKACSRLGLDRIAFIGNEDGCFLKSFKDGDSSADTYSIDLGVETDDEFNFILKPERLKLIPGEYQVKLSANGLSSFESKNVTYFIPCESSSSYQKKD